MTTTDTMTEPTDLAARHATAMRDAHLAYFQSPNGAHQPEPYADWMATAAREFWQQETEPGAGG